MKCKFYSKEMRLLFEKDINTKHLTIIIPFLKKSSLVGCRLISENRNDFWETAQTTISTFTFKQENVVYFKHLAYICIDDVNWEEYL